MIKLENDKIRDQAWLYFELHAKQRMSLFNFYIPLSTAIFAGIAALMSLEYAQKLIVIAFCLILIAVSIVFWLLDKRTKYLIRHSESIIKEIEKGYNIPENLMLFNEEENKTIRNKKNHNPNFTRMISYSKAFRSIYLLFILIGVVVIVIQIIC